MPLAYVKENNINLYSLQNSACCLKTQASIENWRKPVSYTYFCQESIRDKKGIDKKCKGDKETGGGAVYSVRGPDYFLVKDFCKKNNSKSRL